MREELAALMHEIWGKWWHYVFQQSAWDKESDGMLIPGHLVERWNRQMTTLYDALSEKEKDSDRKGANKVLALMRELDPLGVRLEEARYAMIYGNESNAPVPTEVVENWLAYIEDGTDCEEA